ncbi:MAG TPA: NAD-dependent epimerase/dehydratase family protein [Gemmatimonadaceae bacterium]|nr:NAD-dependent epimerase/dehydratase family protein [Gemmatimonadaceae bacterium]
MIAVVTGGSGFIGQNLVRRLLSDGHEVRCLVRPHGAQRALPAGAVRFVVDFEAPASLQSSRAFDDVQVVYHLAGATTALREQDFIRANVEPTRHVLGALAARRLRPRFVYVSSQAAAGPATSLDRPVVETDDARPVEAYGRSKLQAEHVVASFSDRIPTTIVRPCAVLGPHDRDFLRLFQLARHGALIYPGTASHWMSVLHVDDVVAGLIAAANTDAAVLRSYFLASARAVQWRELGEHIARETAIPVRQIDLPRTVVRLAASAAGFVGALTGRVTLANRHKAALARQRYWVCSAVRARTELRFRETRSLPDAVRDTYLWYLEHGWLPGSRSRFVTVA